MLFFYFWSQVLIKAHFALQEIADTSDAVYERRHRKYEAFEKRQRVR